MDEWLVVAAIGPVGHFIGGGRRSRDLWWGSTWVSECTRVVAETLARSGARLFLPSLRRLGDIEDLLLEGSPLSYGGRITNHVAAVVTASDSKQVAEQIEVCERAACDKLAQILQAVHDGVIQRQGERRQAVLSVVEAGPFRAQVEAICAGDFVELYAAWTPFRDGAWERAGKLLAARKSARLFTAPAWAKGERRKSDLDQGRDSVLRSGHVEDQKDAAGPGVSLRLARAQLGIRPDEDLDAIGLARRIAMFQGGPFLKRLPFPPLSRVAADAWLQAVASDSECSAALAQIRDVLEEATQDPLFFAWCSPARDPEVPWSETSPDGGLFPFDASVLLEGGLDALVREVELVRKGGAEGVGQALERLKALRRPIGHLHRLHGVPNPYYGLITMDGDGIGAALEKEPGGVRQKERIEALDSFADRAEEIIRNHHGCAFFVGGDELTAYLPVASAPAAARALSRGFKEVEESFADVAAVSLSGGLVLAHVKADLRATRSLSGDALASAKRERSQSRAASARSWLEVREMPRSGVARSCGGDLETLVGSLETWQELLQSGELAGRSAHLLLSYRDRFAEPEATGRGSLGLDLARQRMLSQAVRSGREVPDPRLEERVRSLLTWDEAERFAAELTIAKRLLESQLGLPLEAAAAR